MDIKDLEYFVKACELESFSLAADEFYTTQSSVSKSIIRLEKELDVKLFTRLHHGIRMTEAGEFLYARLDEMLPMLLDTFQEIHLYSNRSRLWIYADLPKNLFHLDDLCETFAREHPEVDLRLESKIGDYAIQELEAKGNRYDYAIGHHIINGEDEQPMLRLHEDSLWVIVPISNPLSQKEVLSIYDLSSEKIVYKSMHIGHALEDIQTCLQLSLNVEDLGSQYYTRQIVMGSLEHLDAITLFFKSDLDIFAFETVKAIPLKECSDTPMVLLPISTSLDGEVYRCFEAYLVKHIAKSKSTI